MIKKLIEKIFGKREATCDHSNNVTKKNKILSRLQKSNTGVLI